MEESTANNAVLEALACGTPVIATDIGGVRDYMGEDCGALVPPEDPDAMVDAILDISSDADIRQEMGAAARRQAETLAWPRVARQLEALYRSIE